MHSSYRRLFNGPLKALLALLAVIVLGSVCAVHAADWSDASIAFSYGTSYKEPGRDTEIAKKVASLSYVGGYKYGVNFFGLDMRQSDSVDRAFGGSFATNSARGAQEIYVAYNHTLSLGKVSGAAVKFGPVRDVGLEAGFHFNAYNNNFGSGLVKYIAGPKLDFDVPGFLTLGLFAVKEHNNNAFAVNSGLSSGKVSFKVAPQVGAVRNFEVPIGVPVVLKGYGTWTGKKGKDGFGGDTAAELWIDSSFLVDIGSLAGKPKTFYAGLGYIYIKNKYGVQSSLAGSKNSVPTFKVDVHF